MISYKYVDLRSPAERTRDHDPADGGAEGYTMPGCEEMRLSKPSRPGGRGEGLTIGLGELRAGRDPRWFSAVATPGATVRPSGRRRLYHPPAAGVRLAN